ncbi:kinase-like domain-containing protein, partial [Glomus cerebriforme]
IVMEYANKNSLLKYLRKNGMTWKEKIKALLDFSIGLDLLHSSRLIHRDLHPGNLLFNCLSNEKDLLITDLGLCMHENEEIKYTESDKIFGVLPYIAPEVLKGKPYTKKSDVYSFGMVMYFIATGNPPFYNIKPDTSEYDLA